MSKFVIRVELTGYREYEVEANNKEQARDNYLERLGEPDSDIKILDESIGEESWISNITKKKNHLHY